MTWTPKTVWITGSGIGALFLVLPNLGRGVDEAVKILGTTSTAYAAKAQADEVDTEFHEYLTEQRAYTAALQSYVQQQQQLQQQMPNTPYQPPYQRPSPEIRERDATGQVWCCATSAEECWQTKTWRRCP